MGRSLGYVCRMGVGDVFCIDLENPYGTVIAYLPRYSRHITYPPSTKPNVTTSACASFHRGRCTPADARQMIEYAATAQQVSLWSSSCFCKLIMTAHMLRKGSWQLHFYQQRGAYWGNPHQASAQVRRIPAKLRPWQPTPEPRTQGLQIILRSVDFGKPKNNKTFSSKI
jgi:hypothetical protein